MRRAAIVNPVRTAVGTYGGSLKDVAVEDLAATVVKEVMKRSDVDPALVEDVVFAQSYPNGETPCLGRWVAMHAGLPTETPGMQLDRRCAGGLMSIATASMMVQSGAADVVIAGGAESMSRIEHYTTGARWGTRAGGMTLHDRLDRGRERSQPTWRYGEISGMIETADVLAAQQGITREAADEYSVRSHQRAIDAWDNGVFNDAVVPVEVPQRKGDPIQFARDEGMRPGTSMESLAKLRLLRKDGVVTAGNASQQNDAAAACLIVAEDKLDELGLEPIAFLHSWTAVGCEPGTMGWGPVPAVAKLFAKSGLSWDDIDLVELNEAFAAQVLAVLKGWGWDEQDKLNVNGGGISLGHPIAATGVRIMTDLVHEMKRRDAKYGLETMCVGSGQGMAAVFERA